MLTTATTQPPSGFAAVLESCSVLVDGLAVDADVEPGTPVAPGSTIDILPPSPEADGPPTLAQTRRPSRPRSARCATAARSPRFWVASRHGAG